MSEVEKSVAEQLKELMDAQVAEKADKSDLEGVVREEALEVKADKADLEGVVKSEQLDEVKSATAEAIEAAKAEIREEIVAKMAHAPAAAAVEKADVDDFKLVTKASGEEVMQKTVMLTKSELEYNGADISANGARVDQHMPYYTLIQFNPFREYQQTMPVTTSSIKLPDVSGIAFSMQDDAQLLNARGSGGGTLASRTINLETYETWNSFSRPNLEDISGVRDVVTSMILQEYSRIQATTTRDRLNASVDSSDAKSISAVNTGAAAALFASGGDIVDTLADLIDGLDIAYRAGSAMHVSTNLYKEILLASKADGANGAGFAFDPQSGQNVLFGYPLVVNGYLEAGDTADDISAYFGQWNRGLLVAERMGLEVEEYMNLNPGMVNYYGVGRFEPTVWDTSALVGLQTSA